MHKVSEREKERTWGKVEVTAFLENSFNLDDNTNDLILAIIWYWKSVHKKNESMQLFSKKTISFQLSSGTLPAATNPLYHIET